jgi:ribose 5-phosphate isomerase A
VNVETEKQLVAHAGAQLVENGMRVGLGTGSTVSYLLGELARRDLDCVFVATSPRTERDARALGLNVQSFDSLDRLDLALDGADQVGADGWLNKGGGGAHTREKLVASAATSFVVLVDSSKLVDSLHGPVPVELMAFGLASTLRRLFPTEVRTSSRSPDGGVLADYRGELNDPAALASWLSSTPGVVEHGLFAPGLVDRVLAGVGSSVSTITSGGQ